jgi:hypothetical protein
MYYSFYAPIPTAAPLVWEVQTITCGLICGWNLVEAVPALTLASGYALFNALMFGFFGITLATVPSLLYGPPSPIAYWTVWEDIDLLAARGLGIAMIGLVLIGYYYYRAAGGSFCKQMTIWNLILNGLLCIPAFYGGESSVESMWLIQLCVDLPVLIVGIFLEINGATGKWVIDFKCPECGLNCPSLNYFFLIWYLPFILGFYINPNYMFGPAGPMPVSMFLVPFGETSLFFTKVWVTAMLVTVLGPFVFGLSHASVAKQLMFAHLAYFGLFLYVLLEQEIMNVLLMGPLSGLNLVFFLLALYAVLPAQSGEELL